MPVSKPYGADGWGLDDEQRYKDHNPMAVPPGSHVDLEADGL